jgi:WhiB family redox-sensing transcriptional regulator
LADSLDNEIEFGVWGGMTERERRALLRRRPDVKSWRTLLETARLEHTRNGVVTIPAQQVASAVPGPVVDVRSRSVDLRERTSVA